MVVESCPHCHAVQRVWQMSSLLEQIPRNSLTQQGWIHTQLWS
jgi:glutaredoxin